MWISPLAPLISELLLFTCINQEKGCSVQLYRAELVKHEKVCKYSENLVCPGLNCTTRVSLASVKEHISTCFDLSDTRNSFAVGVSEEFVFTNTDPVNTIQPVLRFVESSQDAMVLYGQMAKEKTVLFFRLLTEPVNRYILELKVIGHNDTTRSIQGEPVPFNMRLEDAVKNGYTLEFTLESLEKMTRFRINPCQEYRLHIQVTLLKQIEGPGQLEQI